MKIDEMTSFLQGLRSLKNWLLQKLRLKGPNSLLNIGYFGALIFEELKFFDPKKYNCKTSWPQKISIFKILIDTIITLVLMIKKGL